MKKYTDIMQEITNGNHLEQQNEIEINNKNTSIFISDDINTRILATKLFEQVNDNIRDINPPLFDWLCIEDIIQLITNKMK